MNASCKGAQNTRLWNIHHAQLEPILRATSGHGGLFFCVWHVIMCMQAPVSYDKQNSFPHLFISAPGRKQPERERKKSQKGCLSSSHNIWLHWMSPLVFSLDWACHFSWLLLYPDMHHQLIGRNERIREKKWSSSALVAAQDPAFGSQQRSQGKICTGIKGSSRHDNRHHGCSICGLSPTVLQELKGPPISGVAEVSECYYGTFQHGNSR